MSTRPRSGGISPAAILRNVDLPHPIMPTIDTNSPRSIESVASVNTRRASEPEPKLLQTPEMSMNAIDSNGPEPCFGKPHEPVEDEADDANRENREQNMRVDQAVVFLPEKAAHARRAGEHLARDDHEPRDAETQSEASEHIRQRRWHHDLRERREGRQTQDLRDVPIILRNRADARHRVDDRGPHRADGNRKQG